MYTTCMYLYFIEVNIINNNEVDRLNYNTFYSQCLFINPKQNIKLNKRDLLFIIKLTKSLCLKIICIQSEKLENHTF